MNATFQGMTGKYSDIKTDGMHGGNFKAVLLAVDQIND